MAELRPAGDVWTAAAVAPVLAGVVVFHPDPDQLRSLVAILRPQVSGVILFLNSPIPADLGADLAAAPDVSVIEAASNLGIGAGLNILGLAAVLQGASAIVFFDQDSTPDAGMIARLATAWVGLEAAGHRPAVVSPYLVTKAGAASKAPRYRFLDQPAVGEIRRAAFVPTSGSLVATEVLRRSGFFRADFFIDGIDLEWSFRVAHQGYSCWVHTGCPMPHAVGSGVIGSRRLGWSMPNQRPFRMYCMVRNTLYGLRLAHIPVGWKLRQLAYLPVQTIAYAFHHRLRRSIVILLLSGLRDGLAGRLGAPKGMAL